MINSLAQDGAQCELEDGDEEEGKKETDKKEDDGDWSPEKRTEISDGCQCSVPGPG